MKEMDMCTVKERMQMQEYVDSFEEAEWWDEATKRLKKINIQEIKRDLLKKKIYKGYRFNTDHLDPITKVRVGSNNGTFGSVQRTVELNRVRSTVKIVESTLDNEEYSVQIVVGEQRIEEFFRQLEHKVFKYKMELENDYLKQNPHRDFDDGYVEGKITWNNRDSIEFGPVFEYDSVDVETIVDDAKDIVKQAISMKL